ncbi:flagellar basal-body MS-ring/collar protein FliF [Granulicella aggregans]|jgi:flagellar M-ring protein FliF|uniref:flagellar basal-body MS-ring/collar protein FliF n=1 Tax=Granulicella aggregans TaxID=474949 RepID=UPI0021E075D4|nr:flagellar basal-body MS-ring/collar protein FliF [Granulicella aggregans]
MAETSQIFAQLKQFWMTRTPKQRLMLGAGAVATVGLVGLFANLMSTPDYKPLMSGLETADAQTISAELKSKNIPYQLSADGKSISVPSDQLDAARLDISSSSPTHSGRMGFEIFDKVSWGQTEFDEKVNYQRALEGELERTITTLANVKSARVHLVMATDSVFVDRERGAKASVTLKLARGGLTHDETASIQRMVSGAVEGLKPSDVSIIDADSNLALNTGGDAGGDDGAERQLSQRLIATLGPVVGADHIRASVNVEYDPSTMEENLEKYDPSVSATLQIQRSDESSGGGKVAVGGVPGTTSNVPQKLPNVPVTNGDDSNAQVSKTESATYGVNKISRHSMQPAGRIKRITAALLVDDAVTRKLEKNGKWTEVRTKRTPQELEQIQTLATNAIGLDTARGDAITVQNLSFASAAPDERTPATVFEQARKGLSDYSSIVRYAMLAILFLMAYVLMIRPMQKKVLEQVVQMPTQPVLAAAESPVPALPTSVSAARQLREQLGAQVEAEPAKSARLLQAWLREEIK